MLSYRANRRGGGCLSADADTVRSLGCWCDSDLREPFGDDYVRCGGCGTLIAAAPIDVSYYGAVGDDEEGFYGRRYWEERVPRVLGLPSLEERSRSDLFERCAWQLERILEHRRAEGRLLELGCGHGG
ncbi:MAG: hypothetical protein R3190_18160, partial [Thermoanaerobaculia bacterium]|nr:hypothetical protein [Thermoanaerobaculia bacterium]